MTKADLARKLAAHLVDCLGELDLKREHVVATEALTEVLGELFTVEAMRQATIRMGE